MRHKRALGKYQIKLRLKRRARAQRRAGGQAGARVVLSANERNLIRRGARDIADNDIPGLSRSGELPVARFAVRGSESREKLTGRARARLFIALIRLVARSLSSRLGMVPT